jgi:membrane protease YdiL (CAAX protease family)
MSMCIKRLEQRENSNMTVKQAAKKRIITYLIAVFALSTPFYIANIVANSNGDGQLSALGDLAILGLMWMPAVAALVTTLIYQRNVRGLGWSPGKVKYLALGYLLPIVYAGIAYGIVWVAGLGAYDGSAAVEKGGLAFFLANALTLGVLQAALLALGEEIGWRGLLVPQMARITTFNRMALITGLIWGLWHVPLLLFGDYNAGTPWWYALLCFTVLIVGMNFAFAWLRLASGSIWPAVLMQASHNLIIQGVFDELTANTGNTAFFTGEFGLMLALLGIIVAIVFARLPLPSSGKLSSGVETTSVPAQAG